MPDGLFGKKEDKEGKGEGKEPKHSFGGSLFGKHEAAGAAPAAVSDLSNQINNLSRRLRLLEERYNNLRKNTQLTDQNILKFNKDYQREISALTSDVTELRRDLLDLKDKVRLIVKELVACAKTEDVKVLERYINMWEPVNFVTQKDVEKIVEDKLNELRASENQNI